MLYRDPCVYLVEEEYQIVFNAEEKGVAWVEIGGESWRDSQGGLMRSETLVHRVSVPQAALDAAGAYTVCFRALPERRPYFPELGVEERYSYRFQPAPETGALRILLMADTHSMVAEPTAAARAAGDFDLLALCGDLPAESKQLSDIRAIFDVTSGVTHGEKPVIFAQGNHDYRGRLATELGDYVGRRDGCSWYTFRIDPVWCVVLDCGEDKADTNPEYGGLVDCHSMRLKETAWLRDVAVRAEETYLAPGITTRLAFCHVTFMTEDVCIHVYPDPEQTRATFDIERDIYREWTEILTGMGVDAMLCGHTHVLSLTRPGDPAAHYGMGFPVLVGAEQNGPGLYRCALLTLQNGHMTAQIASSDGMLTDWAQVF